MNDFQHFIFGCLAFFLLVQPCVATQHSDMTTAKDYFDALVSGAHNVELSTDKTSASSKYFFRGLMIRRRNNAASGLAVAVARDGKNAALLISKPNGAPLVYQRNGFMVTLDPDKSGGLVIYPGGNPRFILAPTILQPDTNPHQGMIFDVAARSTIAKPDIQLQFPGLLRGLKKESTTITVDPDHAGVLHFHAANYSKTITMNPPRCAFPINALTGTSHEAGSKVSVTFGIYDILVGQPAPLRLFGITQADVEQLPVPVRVLTQEDLATMPHDMMASITRDADGNAAKRKQASQAMSKLFTNNVHAKQSYKITRLKNDLLRNLLWGARANHGSSPLEASLKDARQKLWYQILASYRIDGYESMQAMSDRTAMHNKLVGYGGSPQVHALTKALTSIAVNKKLGDSVRLLGIDLLADIGTAKPKQTLQAIESSVGDPEALLHVALATARVRLGVTPPNSASYLTAQMKNTTNPIGLRARCLEALCLLDRVPANDRDVLVTTKQTLDNRIDAWDVPTERTLHDLASCRTGRHSLTSDYASNMPLLNRLKVFSALWNRWVSPKKASLSRRPYDSAYLQFVKQSAKIASDSKADRRLRSRVVHTLLTYCGGPVDGYVQDFVQHNLRKDGEVQWATDLIRHRKSVLKWSKALACTFSNESKSKLRLYIIMSITLGVPSGKNAEAVTSLLHRAMSDRNTRVKSGGLYAAAALTRQHSLDNRVFRDQIAHIVAHSHDPLVVRLALFNVQLMSKGQFNLEDAPTDKTGWPLSNNKAKKWWSAHGEALRDAALRFLKQNK